MAEAERAFASLHLRGRVAVALALLVFVGVAQETGFAGPELPARALVIGVALAFTASLEEVASRRARRQVAATIGTIAEFFAFALAVALFDRYSAAAPAVLLWPIALGAVSLRRVYLLYLAAMGAAIVVEIQVLRPGSRLADVAAGRRPGAPRPGPAPPPGARRGRGARRPRPPP